MNKYTLGTIVGTALLGLAKKNIGSKSKYGLKVDCSIEAMVHGEVTVYFDTWYTKIKSLTEKIAPTIWDSLYKEEIEDDDWDDSEFPPPEDDPKFLYYRHTDGKEYKVATSQILTEAQRIVGERIESIIDNDPNFLFPAGFKPEIHSISIDTDGMYTMLDNPFDDYYDNYVEDKKAFFWLRLYWDEPTCKRYPIDENQVADEMDDLWAKVLNRIVEHCINLLNQEFGVVRIHSSWDADYDREIDVVSELLMKKNGEWVPYKSSKPRDPKLRKR